jgi:hypothetical protein
METARSPGAPRLDRASDRSPRRRTGSHGMGSSAKASEERQRLPGPESEATFAYTEEAINVTVNPPQAPHGIQLIGLTWTPGQPQGHRRLGARRLSLRGRVRHTLRKGQAPHRALQHGAISTSRARDPAADGVYPEPARLPQPSRVSRSMGRWGSEAPAT